ncbi:MAG: ribonucleotide reductase subunit alpha [Rubrivivax sp. SCN 70-15]|nr:MAG: ribonucleotide reductase subunit alpha [Rubrivivax sp. SCN 70-15]
MNITNFEELLAAARAQPSPQRLLLVFAGAELGADATPEQRAAFAEGHGGELVPLMCVDKAVDEITSFAALVDESRRAGPPWAIVFVTALSGTASAPPDSKAAEAPLQRMVGSIRVGALNGMIPFDTSGEAVTLG